MTIKDISKQVLVNLKKCVAPLRVSRVRAESNLWLKQHAAPITGNILSIGSGNDSDGQYGKYQDYFSGAESYTTSEISSEYPCDLVLDVRCMPELSDQSFDCVFCSGVLEHVDDFHSAVKEIARITKPGGILLLGLPFGQPLHLVPQDFWRFTEFGIRSLLKDDFELIEIKAMDTRQQDLPSAYWTKAKRLQ